MNIDLLKRRVLVLGAGEQAAAIPQRMRRRSDASSVSALTPCASAAPCWAGPSTWSRRRDTRPRPA